MAMYVCGYCNEFKDDDWNPGSEDPRETGDLICEDCIVEIEEDLEFESL